MGEASYVKPTNDGPDADGNSKDKTEGATQHAYQHGTAPISGSQPMLDSPQSQGHPSEPERDWHDRCKLKLLFGNLFVTTAAFITAGIAAYHAYQQVVVAKDTAQKQLRAYVAFESATVDKIKPGELLVGYTINNFGVTPAYDLETTLYIGICGDLISDYRCVTRWTPAPTVGFVGKAISVVDIPSRGFSEPEVAVIEAAEKSFLYLIGRTNYRDVYGTPRGTDFCFKYIKRRDGSGYEFVYCEHLNEADERRLPPTQDTPKGPALDWRYYVPSPATSPYLRLPPANPSRP